MYPRSLPCSTCEHIRSNQLNWISFFPCAHRLRRTGPMRQTSSAGRTKSAGNSCLGSCCSGTSGYKINIISRYQQLFYTALLSQQYQSSSNVEGTPRGFRNSFVAPEIMGGFLTQIGGFRAFGQLELHQPSTCVVKHKASLIMSWETNVWGQFVTWPTLSWHLCSKLICMHVLPVHIGKK